VVNAEQASSDSHPKGDREERALDLPGGVAAARSEGAVRNRRGLARRLASSEAASIGAEREVSSPRAEVRELPDEHADLAVA